MPWSASTPWLARLPPPWVSRLTNLTPIIVLDEIDSTNADARRRAEAGNLGPAWIMAHRQTAGKGRLGRAWETGTGNLAATLLTTTDKPPVEAAQVSFIAALAVHDLAVGLVPASLVSVKWPNDLMIADRKASGILVESGALPAHQGLWLAVGIGVNLTSPPMAAERPATSFAEHALGAIPPPVQALTILALAFDRWWTTWMANGFAPIATAWTERAYGLGRHCEARLPAETVSGTAEGLDLDGALRLRLASGEVRRITAGDVFF